VVAEDRGAAAADDVPDDREDGGRVCAVADEVAEEDAARRARALRVLEARAEGLEVGVDVCQQGDAQEGLRGEAMLPPVLQ
jgi:hypothetical protein